MDFSTYETHIMKNSLLPFIFHLDTLVDHTDSTPNWHENIEILYCIKGSGIAKYGLESIEFSVGDILVVNADTLHTIISNTQIQYHCLIIDNSFCEDNGIPITTLRFQKLIHNPLLNTQFEQVVKSFQDYDQEKPYAITNIRHAVLGLLLTLCASHIDPNEQTAHSVSSERIKKAIAYIRQNIAQKITLDDIADHVGISKFHLSREIKAFTRMTVVDTINQIRCSEAQRMIKNGSSVSAAAISCGFENLSYFTRTFKKFFHVRPSDFLVR